jgi:hypothetical protein
MYIVYYIREKLLFFPVHTLKKAIMNLEVNVYVQKRVLRFREEIENRHASFIMYFVSTK